MTDLREESEIVEEQAAVSSCSNVGFEKLKYVDSQYFVQNYLDHYEKSVITDKILMEVILKLDPFKTVSTRQANRILDVLGDVGGFY